MEIPIAMSLLSNSATTIFQKLRARKDDSVPSSLLSHKNKRKGDAMAAISQVVKQRDKGIDRELRNASSNSCYLKQITPDSAFYTHALADPLSSLLPKSKLSASSVPNQWRSNAAAEVSRERLSTFTAAPSNSLTAQNKPFSQIQVPENSSLIALDTASAADSLHSFRDYGSCKGTSADIPVNGANAKMVEGQTSMLARNVFDSILKKRKLQQYNDSKGKSNSLLKDRCDKQRYDPHRRTDLHSIQKASENKLSTITEQSINKNSDSIGALEVRKRMSVLSDVSNQRFDVPSQLLAPNEEFPHFATNFQESSSTDAGVDQKSVSCATPCMRTTNYGSHNAIVEAVEISQLINIGGEKTNPLNLIEFSTQSNERFANIDSVALANGDRQNSNHTALLQDATLRCKRQSFLNQPIPSNMNDSRVREEDDIEAVSQGSLYNIPSKLDHPLSDVTQNEFAGLSHFLYGCHTNLGKAVENRVNVLGFHPFVPESPSDIQLYNNRNPNPPTVGSSFLNGIEQAVRARRDSACSDTGSSRRTSRIRAISGGLLERYRKVTGAFKTENAFCFHTLRNLLLLRPKESHGPIAVGEDFSDVHISDFSYLKSCMATAQVIENANHNVNYVEISDLGDLNYTADACSKFEVPSAADKTACLSEIDDRSNHTLAGYDAASYVANDIAFNSKYLSLYSNYKLLLLAPRDIFESTELATVLFGFLMDTHLLDAAEFKIKNEKVMVVIDTERWQSIKQQLLETSENCANKLNRSCSTANLIALLVPTSSETTESSPLIFPASIFVVNAAYKPFVSIIA